MKKIFFTLLLTSITITNIYSQSNDPGFGDEGGGDAQDAPNQVPISNNIHYLFSLGLFLGAYHVYKSKKISRYND